MKHHWYYHWPGMTYAYDIRFDEPVSKPEVRRALRLRWGLGRLLKHTEVW